MKGKTYYPLIPAAVGAILLLRQDGCQLPSFTTSAPAATIEPTATEREAVATITAALAEKKAQARSMASFFDAYADYVRRNSGSLVTDKRVIREYNTKALTGRFQGDWEKADGLAAAIRSALEKLVTRDMQAPYDAAQTERGLRVIAWACREVK